MSSKIRDIEINRIGVTNATITFSGSVRSAIICQKIMNTRNKMYI